VKRIGIAEFVRIQISHAGLNSHEFSYNMQKSLDSKLARIAADPSCGDFILADAKDADMAFGISAFGPKYNAASERMGYCNAQEFRDQIREIVSQKLVDILLMSVNTSDCLTVNEGIFDKSPVTPAIRANDTTDIWIAGGKAAYGSQPSQPFRTAILQEAAGTLGDAPMPWVNLGLYSCTLNNDATLDRATLQAYRDFRGEAQQAGFRHFLEVFVPNAPVQPVDDVPRFINDSIVRMLAGIGSRTRPLFLKIPYFGPAAMEQLVSYDSSLVVGILGGSSGTTFDAFNMLWEAKKYGARAALFGRKINNAEHQLSFITHLRALADGNAKPSEAVRAYHGDLEKLRIKPYRSLNDDLRPAV
jgi:hypothetical protein